MATINVYDFNAQYTDVSVAFATEAAKTLRASLARIEHCLRQLSDGQLWWRSNPQMNAIGNLILHLTGNLEQWAIAPIENRPTTRNRPEEFAQRTPISKAILLQKLQSVVERCAVAIETLTVPDALLRHCQIAGALQPYNTDLLAVTFHAVSHFEGHTQEIIAMTRQLRGDKYEFLWTPKAPQQVNAK